MRLLLIRHGETAANAARILQRPDEPLSERGLAQARRLAQRLSGSGIDRIVSSDFRRAAMTADALARTTGAAVAYEPLLQERNFGAWRGTPYANLPSDPFDEELVPPGGESWAMFHERAARAFEAVVAGAGSGSLAVVTHGLVCRAWVLRHLDPEGTGHPDRWSNTSVTEVVGPPWRMVRVNCVMHLDEVDAGGGRA